MASIIKIELNLVPGAAPGGIMPRVRVSQGDAQDRILQFELYDGSEVADLTDVVSIFFGGQKPDGNGFTVLCTAQNNLITGILTPQSTVLAGLIPCKLYLTTATGSVRSATFDMQIDPDPLNDAGTSDTDITAIVAAAGNYAAKAQQSAEDAAASAETAATAGATAGEAAAQEVVNNKLDKVGGDSAADIITFTSSDDATESGIIIPSGGEETVPALVTGATHAGLLGNLSKIALNSRKLINTVKRIWTSVANAWVSGAEYKAGNVVTYINGHTYICILDHTSSSSITPLNATYWEDKTLGDMIASLNSNYANISHSKIVYQYTPTSATSLVSLLNTLDNKLRNIVGTNYYDALSYAYRIRTDLYLINDMKNTMTRAVMVECSGIGNIEAYNRNMSAGTSSLYRCELHPGNTPIVSDISSGTTTNTAYLVKIN